MADTRVYRTLTTLDGSAVTQQSMLAVPSGEAPASPSLVEFVEKTRTEGGTTYNTGEYYADIPTYGLWDFYVKDNSTGIDNLYQERQFVGGVDLLSGGLLGFNVYESIRPAPNDGSYVLITFPATGLDTTKTLSCTFGTVGIEKDAAYGIVRDMTNGVINIKIKAPVIEGAHMVVFMQGTEESRAIFRVVDVANAYTSPLYNYIRNPEFANDTDTDGVPDEWSIAAYWSTPAAPPTVTKTILTNGLGYSIRIDSFTEDLWLATTVYVLDTIVRATAIGAVRFRCTTAGTSGATEPTTWDTTPGNTTVDGTVTWTCEAIPAEGMFQANDVVYVSQTAYIGGGLVQPQTFTCSISPNIDNLNGAAAQMSLTAIARINGADTILATSTPITFGSSDRAGLRIDAPAGTTHIRTAYNIVNKTGSVLPAATGSGNYTVVFQKAKLNVGLDINWYS